MQKKRKLTRLDIEEISFVDRPANRQPFAFTKSAMTIEESDTEDNAAGLIALADDLIDAACESAGVTVGPNGRAELLEVVVDEILEVAEVDED